MLTSYDGGTDTVWSDRARASTWWPRSTATRRSTCWSTGRSGSWRWSPRRRAARTAWPRRREEALRLRDLLKFDFFFARRRDFAEEMAAGAGDHRAERRPTGCTSSRRPTRAAGSSTGKPLVAPLVLRPFLDAYHLVADRLAAWEDEEIDEARFLDECLRVGRQWALQGRLASEESVSLELFKPALRLAGHRDLLDSDRTAPAEAARGLPRRTAARRCAG